MFHRKEMSINNQWTKDMFRYGTREKKKKNTIILCSHKIEGRERIKINEKYYLS
jgi:hypothetical protein